MQPQRISLRDARMLEGAGLVFPHAESLHDRSRALVCRHGERNDLVQAEPLEAEAKRTARAFARESLAPVGLRKAPADFHAGRARQLSDRRLQADEADKFAGVAPLSGPQAPAALG